MDQKKLHILSLLAALTAATIFGMSFMFSKMALATAAPTVLLAFRFTVAVAAMSLVIALNALVGKVRGKPLFAFSLKGKPVGKLLLLGIVQPVAYFIFENYGILYTSAAVAGTIIAAVPVCCILMDVLVLHERVTRRQVLCALGAIGGVALISVGGAVMISALGLLFLLVSAIPFILVFDKKKPQARELVPIAVMAAIAVVGRTVFEIIPLPNFKPCSAIIIITAVAFGPEAGFLTGALTAFVSNFIFGQGPWTPWQMFTWGLVGFLAGILQNAGAFKGVSRPHFTAKLWDRLCPENTNRGDLLHFVRQLTDHAPLRLCLYGFLSGFLYGWIMNLYFIIGYVSPLTWQTIGAAYLSSFFFDFCHGLCTFLVLWALGDPWVRKLERVKIKFGLTAEERNYVLPPSTFEIARENYE